MGVIWNKDEGHICGSEKGLTALVLQSDGLEIVYDGGNASVTKDCFFPFEVTVR